MQSLQILHLGGRHTQRNDNSFDSFRSEPRLRGFETCDAAFRPLHLRQYLLENSCFSNLVWAPHPGHSFQQPR